MDNNAEAKAANRKALPKFILIMVLSMVIGGCFGYCAAKYGLNTLSGSIKAAGDFFGLRIAPWLMLAVAILEPSAVLPLYRQAKKLLAAWDGEDEQVSDDVDKKLNIILWLTGAAFIISFFLIAASYSGGIAMFDQEENILPYFVSIAAFFAVLIETVIIQMKCIDTVRKTNPEKTVSAFDMRFKKKWLDSCDEAEKIVIGKCAYKAYHVSDTACSILAIILALCALVFDIGFLPSLVVCVVWFASHTAYCREAMKYAKTGNRIS